MLSSGRYNRRKLRHLTEHLVHFGSGISTLMTASFRLLMMTMLPVLLAAAPAAGEPSVSGVRGAEPPPRELVVLVHGMGRTSLSMLPLSWSLKRAGYDVMNWGYSSTCCGIAELGSQLQHDLREELEERGGEPPRVHFVGHSLGNIIIRWVLAHEPVSETTGRVVMLAPPNQGSRVADQLSPSLGWLLKPLSELRSEPMRTSTALLLPEPVFVGVIAGRYDGKVTVDETRMDGMDGHVVVAGAHSFLMFRSDVKQLIVDFLRDGVFLTDSQRHAPALL
ncbi:MAG: alpha/beta fold hydrolase [Gemmatimonadetes bacterium]|nr:alpha/beta fold hydrolase [Gemmatimonadota bacterium]